MEYPLIVLSYHRFAKSEDPYVFSRTYKQFQYDLDTKDFDWITIDDGHASIIKACKMMEEKNIRAKLFISTSLIGEKGYCTWDDIWKLSKKHDICNHSHNHVDLTEKNYSDIWNNLYIAQLRIIECIGYAPRYFVPPWNKFNADVEKACAAHGMIMLKYRTDIKNDSR
jgi:peptidoglycan/xylan/chitin deacetylase (PgdA/CDA1 family)